MGSEIEGFEFPGADGVALAARLDRPSAEPHAFALFAHCFTCGKNLAAARAIAASLTEQGIAVLRFDFTGLGSSEGEFANTDFSSNVGDLVAAAEHERDEYQPPRLLIGHSLGGAAVLAAAGRIEETAAVATIGAPADPGHVEHLLGQATEEIERSGEAEVVLAGRKFRVRREFLEDIRSQALLATVGELDRALIVFHSPIDEYVGIDGRELRRLLQDRADRRPGLSDSQPARARRRRIHRPRLRSARSGSSPAWRGRASWIGQKPCSSGSTATPTTSACSPRRSTPPAENCSGTSTGVQPRRRDQRRLGSGLPTLSRREAGRDLSGHRNQSRTATTRPWRRAGAGGRPRCRGSTSSRARWHSSAQQIASLGGGIVSPTTVFIDEQDEIVDLEAQNFLDGLGIDFFNEL